MCYGHIWGSSSQDVKWTVNCAKMLDDDSFQDSAYLPHTSFRNNQTKRLSSTFSIYNQNTQIQSCMRWRQGSLEWGWVSWGYTDSDKSCLWLFSLWVFISSIVKCVLTSEHIDEFRFKCLWNKPLVCLYSTLEFVFKNPFNSLHTTFTVFFFQALLADKHKTTRNLRTRKHDF